MSNVSRGTLSRTTNFCVTGCVRWQAFLCSTWNIANYRQSGFRPGAPLGRGKVGEVTATFRKYAIEPVGKCFRENSSPSFASPSVFQRDPSDSGGSDTRRTPPTCRNRTAHSAVTAGGPKSLATTRSKVASRSSRRANSSMRPVSTRKSGESGHSPTTSRNRVRFSMESARTPPEVHVVAKTNPGIPPPLPMSIQRMGGVGETSSHAARKSSAWVMWGEKSPGPKKPRALDSSRARGNQF